MDNLSPSPNSPASPERSGGPGPEQFKPGQASGGEQAPAAEQVSGNPSAGAQPAPVKLSPADVAAALASTPTVGQPPAAGQTGATPNPTSAGDVDVIEPEWVDKAEEVIRAHQGDPYAEDEAIEDLQQDYLQKRYGIPVADADADEPKPKGA
jgi:hypothetical protein